MNSSRIAPERVTRPIQLLAAWLVGLIVVDASFLMAAQQITRPDWASGLLVIAAVANVPVFIGALFLLQTKFRPEMQEDAFYAQYLQSERAFFSHAETTTAEVVEHEIVQTAERISKSLGVDDSQAEPIAEILREGQQEVLLAKFGSSRALAELFKAAETWEAVVDQWSKDVNFIKDVDQLLDEGLLEKKYRGYKRSKLTTLGEQIAKLAEEKGVLFSQKNKEIWETQHKQLVAKSE
jgi:hypothetical protein